MKPVEGHALNAYERSQAWTQSTGTWTIAHVYCECGETTSSGVDSLSAAREWHREHKAEVLAGTDKENPA